MAKRTFKTVDVQTIQHGRVVRIKPTWWACKDGDLKQAVYVSNGGAMCNQNKDIADRMALGVAELMGWNVSAVFIEVAFELNLSESPNGFY